MQFISTTHNVSFWILPYSNNKSYTLVKIQGCLLLNVEGNIWVENGLWSQEDLGPNGSSAPYFLYDPGHVSFLFFVFAGTSFPHL